MHWKKSSAIILGLTTSVALLVLPSRASTFNLNPVADAFVTTGPTGNLRATNYGGAGSLSVAGRSSANGEFQSVLRFNLAATRSTLDSQFGAGQWTLQSVSLTLTAVAPGNPIFNATLPGSFGISWMQNDSWVEGSGTPALPTSNGITYNTLTNSFISAGDENLGTFSFNGASTGTANYVLNLTPGFSADLLAGNNVSLEFFAADNSVSYLFNSENFSTSASRPVLSITAVPEPMPLVLFCAAGVAMFGRRFRWPRKDEM